MSSPGRRELGRRFRSLEGFRERYALGIPVVTDALREDDPLLGLVADFLESRRDLFSAGEIRRLAEGDRHAEPGWDRDELEGRIENAGGRMVPGSYRRLDRTTAEAAGAHGESGRRVWRLVRFPPEEIRRRLAWARPFWRALAVGGGRSVRREFEAWAERRCDPMETSRMLATLPRTSIPVTSPVLLSRCDDRCRVYEDESRAQSGDEERSLAAWLAMALEGRRVFEDPHPGSWWIGERGRIVAVGGPIVSISGREAGLLERYLAATLLERRDAAADALQGLLEPRPSARRGRRLRWDLRQAVPERDRLDGDWSDEPMNDLLYHWRIVEEAGFAPRPALVAFWRGLAGWDLRLGAATDLAAAYQRWQAARLADRIVSDAGSAVVGSIAGRLADRLDGPLVAPGGSPPGREGRTRRGVGWGLATFVGAGLATAWWQPGDLVAYALLASLALGLAWVFGR